MTAPRAFYAKRGAQDAPQNRLFRARREVLANMSRIKEIKPYFKSSFLLVMSDAASTEIAVSERQARPLRQRLPGL